MSTTQAPEQWDGYRYHTHARSTGALIVLVDGIAQGLTCYEETVPDEFGIIQEGRWFLICNRHDTLLSDTNQRRLRSHMTCPEGWCNDCYADLNGEGGTNG